MPPTVTHNQINLSVGTDPDTPDTSEVVLYIDSNGMIRQKSDAGSSTPLSPEISVTGILASYGNTGILRFPNGTRVDLGGNATEIKTIPRHTSRRWLMGYPLDNPPSMYLANYGAATEAGTPTNEFKNKHHVRTYQSGGADAGFYMATASHRVSHTPYFSILMHTGASIANQRAWIGLFSAAPGNVATLGTNQALGFSYFSSDSNLSWITSNGTTTTRTTITTMLADSTYVMDCWYDGVTAYFQVNSGTIFTTSLTLPAATTNLAFYARGYEDGSQVNVSFGASYIESD